VLDTLNYATPTGIAMDPLGAFEHGKDMLGGIVHAEDWRADRPGLGLGGVLFEAGSAATGVGAAKTGLRGVSAAADAGDAGQAVRAVTGAADGAAPIAGRASEIAGKLDDLTTLTDDVPSGAARGTHGPTLPPSLSEPNVPRVPDAPRLPESPASHSVPDNAGPLLVPDGAAPRPAEMPPQHVPDAGASHTVVPAQSVPEAGTTRAPEPAGSNPGVAAAEGTRSLVAPSHAAEPMPTTREPAIVGSGSGAAHSSEMPPTGSSGASHGPVGGHSWDSTPPASVNPESHASAPHETTSASDSGARASSSDFPDISDHPDSGAHSHPGGDAGPDLESWDHNVLSDEMRDQNREIDMGSRPDQSEYLPQEFIEHHLESSMMVRVDS
jgi:hypothetical protein